MKNYEVCGKAEPGRALPHISRQSRKLASYKYFVPNGTNTRTAIYVNHQLRAGLRTSISCCRNLSHCLPYDFLDGVAICWYGNVVDVNRECEMVAFLGRQIACESFAGHQHTAIQRIIS